MNELLTDYPIVITQEVIWADMDAYRHVNNAVYFRYFESARMAYFEKRADYYTNKKKLILGQMAFSWIFADFADT